MRRSADPVLFVLLAVSLSTNAYLYRRAPARVAAIQPLKTGDHVPALTGTELNGSAVHITFEHGTTILYVFSPKCIWCERNLENARELAHQSAGRYRFVGVALDDTDVARYIAQRSLDWTVVKIGDATRRAYRMGVTPETLVIGEGGRILHVWSGAYGKPLIEDIASILGVHLPGLKVSSEAQLR